MGAKIKPIQKNSLTRIEIANPTPAAVTTKAMM
jgi:hypothetical protein